MGTTILADFGDVRPDDPGHAAEPAMVSPESRSLWHLIECIAVALAQGYGLARARALAHSAPMTRLLGQRDHLHTEAAMLERELAIFRAQRLEKAPRQRPHFAPQQRAEILQLAALRGWTAKEAAARFGLHPNTIRNWKRAIRDKRRSEELIGAPPWNRLHQAVRWTVHEIRRLCPEREFGTRMIARHMIRAGIQISRTSVRRILEEDRSKPDRKRAAVAFPTPPSQDEALKQLLEPRSPHQVWHADITEIRVLWRRFEVAAVMDGFSRKILALRAFDRRPRTREMVELIHEAIDEGKAIPRFLISDHGSQFRKEFAAYCRRLDTRHVRGKIGVWQLNAKIERFFRTFKQWQRRAWMPSKVEAVQKRVDTFLSWYNEERPHAGSGGVTQSSRAHKFNSEPPRSFLCRDRADLEIEVTRANLAGDPWLPVLDIGVWDGPVAA
ncbi:MAG: DDE-type integrase/transposase/recombinase [Planctomycetota bacterium]